MEPHETPSLSIQIPKEFDEYIDRKIQKAIEAISGTPGESIKQVRYLTRLEVCELLSISLPTLSRYVSKGILKGQRVGSRILFDEAKLKQSLQDLPVKASGR